MVNKHDSEAGKQLTPCFSDDLISPPLVALAGPSGVGKTTLIEQVLRKSDEVVRPPIVTTRPPRDAFEEGSGQFRYVTDSEYLGLQEAGEILASYASHGLHSYGVAKADLAAVPAGRVALMDIDPRNIRQLRRICSVTAIMILPPDVEVLRNRLLGRGPTNDGQGIQQRWTSGYEILIFKEHMDYVLVNDRVARTAQDILSIVLATGLSSKRTAGVDLIKVIATSMLELQLAMPEECGGRSAFVATQPEGPK